MLVDFTICVDKQDHFKKPFDNFREKQLILLGLGWVFWETSDQRSHTVEIFLILIKG